MARLKHPDTSSGVAGIRNTAARLPAPILDRLHMRNTTTVAARLPAQLAALLLLLSATPGLASPGAFAQVTAPSPALRLQDIAMVREKFLQVDKSYTPEARTEAEQRLAALEAKAEGMSEAAFVLELSRIVALADNGHTRLNAAGRARKFNRIEIRLVPFGEEFHALWTRPENASVLGGRLVAIDGHPIGDLREAARSLSGGTPSFRDRFSPYLLESPEQLHALGLADAMDAATYSFAMPDGALVQVKLSALPPSPDRPVLSVGRMLDPTRAGAEPGEWATLIKPEQAPWSVAAGDEVFRWRDAPDMDAIVIDMRSNNNASGKKVLDFLNAAEVERVALGRTNVVLDMRLNGGGNLTLTQAFMADWPEKLGPSGRFVVLTSPWTFSAAISSTLYLKQAGGDRVILIGEAPGDRLEFWAEGMPMTSPSGLVLGPARERHDYQNGCRAYTDCHQNVVRKPIAVPSAGPDILAPWTIGAYSEGRDPGLEAAARILGERG